GKQCLRFTGYFFFQAEDGIRDFHVTGVQTCALPIFAAGKGDHLSASPGEFGGGFPTSASQLPGLQRTAQHIFQSVDLLRQKQERSEERRVGKESRSR